MLPKEVDGAFPCPFASLRVERLASLVAEAMSYIIPVEHDIGARLLHLYFVFAHHVRGKGTVLSREVTEHRDLYASRLLRHALRRTVIRD